VGRSEKRFTWCFVTEERTMILTISGKFFAERIASVSRGGEKKKKKKKKGPKKKKNKS